MTVAHAQPLLLTQTNVIEFADITAPNLDSATPLSWLKNSSRARQTRFVNPQNNIILVCDLAELSDISYVALPGHDLKTDARIKWILYDDNENVLYDTGFEDIASVAPAGEFSAGDTPWNTTVTLLQNIYFKTFATIYDVKTIVCEIDHKFTYIPPVVTLENNETSTTTTESDGILRQDPTTFAVAIEAENCLSREPAGSDSWIEQQDTNASNGTKLYKAGAQFYNTALTGPEFGFQFEAVKSGTYKIYLRLQSTNGNSIYSTFSGAGNPTTRGNIFRPYDAFTDGNFKWRECQTVSLRAGTVHTVRISARDHFMSVDRVVILPSNQPIPADTDVGPAQSAYGTITTTTTSGGQVVVYKDVYQNFVNIRALYAGVHTQLYESFKGSLKTTNLTESTNYETESGYLATGKSQREVRSMTMNLGLMEERDKTVIADHEKRQRGKPFLVSAFPGVGGGIESDHIFLGKITDKLDFSRDYPTISSTNITIKEV